MKAKPELTLQRGGGGYPRAPMVQAKAEGTGHSMGAGAF